MEKTDKIGIDIPVYYYLYIGYYNGYTVIQTARIGHQLFIVGRPSKTHDVTSRLQSITP